MAGYIGSKIAVTQVDGYNRTEADAEFVQVTGDTMTGALTVNTGSAGTLATFTDGVNSNFVVETASLITTVGNTGGSTALAFKSGNAERMRIDSSGNFYLGKTSTSSAVAGIFMQPTGGVDATRSGVRVLTLNRLTSDGDIIEFQKDNAKVGSIGSISGTILSVVSSGTELYIGTSGTADSYFDAPDGVAFSVFQAYDNLSDLGRPNARFDDIYATNGTIQTSDRNEKQDIEALSDAEQRVAVAAKGLLRKYRWKDAVAEKGDAARIHFGIIAQDLQAAFEAEGLDAARYGMFISSTWWEAEVEKTREVEQEDGTTITETYTATETYDEPTEGATERTRLGVRYPELLAFIIAAL